MENNSQHALNASWTKYQLHKSFRSSSCQTSYDCTELWKYIETSSDCTVLWKYIQTNCDCTVLRKYVRTNCDSTVLGKYIQTNCDFTELRKCVYLACISIQHKFQKVICFFQNKATLLTTLLNASSFPARSMQLTVTDLKMTGQQKGMSHLFGLFQLLLQFADLVLVVLLVPVPCGLQLLHFLPGFRKQNSFMHEGPNTLYSTALIKRAFSILHSRCLTTTGSHYLRCFVWSEHGS